MQIWLQSVSIRSVQILHPRRKIRNRYVNREAVILLSPPPVPVQTNRHWQMPPAIFQPDNYPLKKDRESYRYVSLRVEACGKRQIIPPSRRTAISVPTLMEGRLKRI